jgi:hypothetical protein
MRVRTLCAASLASLAAALASAQPPAAPGDASLPPFSAHYVAEWKDIAVGVSDLKLEPGTQPGRYHYRWTISARGIFKLFYSDDVVQQSWLRIVDGHARPDRYLGAEGSKSVSFEFDWDGGQARGQSEGKPVEISLKNGAQDLMSIQIEVMLDLKNGNMPPVFNIIDKDQLKDFIYTREGSARIRTSIGTLDTLVVASQRKGNDRILRMWFAPSLDYIPVQAERWRGGKLEFAMRIKSLDR